MLATASLRELQVLRDQILSWLDEEEDLSPQDILVMAPDIEAYAPFIKGIFSDIEPGAPAIPFTKPDCGVCQENPLADAFVNLLKLASGRFSASELIDFFETPAVHRRFKVAEPELERIRLLGGGRRHTLGAQRGAAQRPGATRIWRTFLGTRL